MLEFIRAVVRPSLVWIGFVCLTVVAVLIVFDAVALGKPISTEAWGIVTGWTALVGFMVGYYFRTREDKS